MQVLKFCLPKQSIIEQLDSGTLIQHKRRKVTVVYIVNDEIQHYLIVRLMSGDKI